MDHQLFIVYCNLTTLLMVVLFNLLKNQKPGCLPCDLTVLLCARIELIPHSSSYDKVQDLLLKAGR